MRRLLLIIVIVIPLLIVYVKAGELIRERVQRNSDIDGALSNERSDRALSSERKDQSTKPVWVNDPDIAGDNLPTEGRSLFDLLFITNKQGNHLTDIPFPFEALVKNIRSKSGNADIKQVVIPMGRSLQRSAGSPDFFKYPRAVIAIDTEMQKINSRNAMPLLKDRLYIGYQEKSNLLEVISYNETQGRFEFQLVKDYRAGGNPRVFYANRAICISCHQNASPIFSRQVWNETNANPKVSFLLNKIRPQFYGIPVNRGIDIPNAIDNATDRANLFSLYQMIWTQGCGGDDAAAPQCRAALFSAALQYKLNREKYFDTSSANYKKAKTQILNQAKKKWPNGLAIGNPDLPNRDPLPGEQGLEPSKDQVNMLLAKSSDKSARSQLNNLANVTTQFDPLVVRLPLEIWSLKDAQQIDQVVRGLASFIPYTEVHALEKYKDYQVIDNVIMSLISELEFDGFTNKPFRRISLMQGLYVHLKINTQSICCSDTSKLPPAKMESIEPHNQINDTKQRAVLDGFYKHCAMCHQTAEQAPPNFLSGDFRKVQSNIAHCAERIYVRLAMWRHPDATRLKSPMPPVNGLHSIVYSETSWKDSQVLEKLNQYVTTSLQDETGKAPDVDSLLNRGYENLRSCLPIKAKYLH